MLKIIYAGTPEFAVPALESLLRSKHRVLAVYTQPDRPAGRGRKLQPSPVKACALAHRVPVFQPVSFKNPLDRQQFGYFQADLMVVAAYGLLLPTSLLDTPRLGCVNIHASLLPRWRGAAPIQRAILAGDEETGITIMQMAKGLDTGDMLASLSLPIAPDWTAADLHDQLKFLGARLLIDTLAKIETGKLDARQQDNSLATYAVKLTKQEARIDWNQHAETIQRQIRAYVPWPVSFTQLQAERLRIWSAGIDATHKSSKPGQVIDHNQNGLFVSCRDSVLQVIELQFAGKKRCGAAEAANARNLSGRQFD
ncbi:MAG: methionyl-tRNA formyltransferase [Gammaproteobacteria bacterium]|nr:methionyl-tRNA formyltransferase [Gammaproteobacteria bacterium]